MLFDGIDYVVQHEVPFAGRPERVLVWSPREELIATAVIDHNVEQIHVEYVDSTEDCSYNYFEFNDANDVEELASWMIANSY